MHPDTFNYAQPTPTQVEQMQRLREAAEVYSSIIEKELPSGPDKTFVLRHHRTTAMWANVAVTRHPDGSPRDDEIAQ